MTERATRRGFAARPGDAESWIKAPETPGRRTEEVSAFTARLTIDVSSAMRGRIKVAAFKRGITVADMLRDLLTREFPADSGDPS
jgi:hypothetical protein